MKMVGWKFAFARFRKGVVCMNGISVSRLSQARMGCSGTKIRISLFF
jgi:hypothetical protein